MRKKKMLKMPTPPPDITFKYPEKPIVFLDEFGWGLNIGLASVAFIELFYKVNNWVITLFVFNFGCWIVYMIRKMKEKKG